MKVVLEKISQKNEESAYIRVADITESVKEAVMLLENGRQSLTGVCDGEKIAIDLLHIYYIESVDMKSFVYTKDGCAEVPYRLYELENMLGNRFFRCSKSMILNSRKIKSVKADGNGRMNAVLLNDEMIVISRSYVKELKKRLGLL